MEDGSDVSALTFTIPNTKVKTDTMQLENLYKSYKAASRCKRCKTEVIDFEINLKIFRILLDG